MEALSQHLSTLGRTEKYDAAKAIWPSSSLTLDNFNKQDYTAFFEFVDREMMQLEAHPQRFAIKTFREAVDLVQTLRDNRTEPSSTVVQTLLARYFNCDEKHTRRSLELSIRIWLTINVNSPSLAVGPTRPYEIPLQWSPDTSLDSLVHDQFVRGNVAGRAKGQARVEGSFTAAYLVRVCRMKLNWTDSLTDHLRPDPKRQTITVYKHKICLWNHLKGGNGCPIPKDVLEEALDSLNLLFPFGDPETEQLLAREGHRPFYELGNCRRDRELDLSKYSCWRTELDDLVDIYRSPPRTWKQLATDRRNLMEWAAFWVTVMVALMTLVTIPCNIIQATFSVLAYTAATKPAATCSCP